MTIKHTLTAAIVSLAFGAALSAQAEPFNDYSSHVAGFAAPSQSARMAVQAELEAFKDRGGEQYVKHVSPGSDMDRQQVRVAVTGFNDKSVHYPG